MLENCYIKITENRVFGKISCYFKRNFEIFGASRRFQKKNDCFHKTNRKSELFFDFLNICLIGRESKNSLPIKIIGP